MELAESWKPLTKSNPSAVTKMRAMYGRLKMSTMSRKKCSMRIGLWFRADSSFQVLQRLPPAEMAAEGETICFDGTPRARCVLGEDGRFLRAPAIEDRGNEPPCAFDL